MDQTRKTAIEVKAEQAIQESDGDQARAFETLQNWIEQDQELRSAVLDDALRLELQGAARRLQAGTKRCPYCSTEISGEALKCPHCGEWLQPSAVAAAGSMMVGSRVWYFSLFTAWLLILFVGFLIYTFLTQ